MEEGTRKRRKIDLDYACPKCLKYFSPESYMIKLTPMHRTQTAVLNDIVTRGDYTTYHPYEDYESALKKVGYDVLVFIASVEEDLGRITCGNAILSGALPKVPYEEVTV